jgi:hypothetical protein
MRHAIHIVATSVAFWLTAAMSFQGASAVGADPEIVFDPPKTVVVRQSNGAPARGELLRIDREELHLRALNGDEVQFKLERVRSVKTSDESFEYWPAQETFDELAGRINTVQGAKLNGTVAAANGGTQQTGQNRSRTRKHKRDDDYGATPDEDGRSGFELRANGNGIDPARQGRADSARPAPQGADDTEPTENGTTDADPAPGAEILVCSNCQKDLPAGFVSGGRCPHCDRVVVFDTGDSNPFAASAGSASPQNPFAANGAPPPAQIPAAAAGAPPAADAGGGGLDSIPLYGKIGIFAAFLVVGWLILQRR